MELFNFLWYIVRKTVKKERNLAELLELYTHGKWNLMVLKLLRVCFKCLTNTLQKLDTHARNTVIRITYLLDFVIDCRRETYFDCCYIILKFLNRNSSKVFFFCCDTYIIQFSFGRRFGWYILFSYLLWIWRDSAVKLSQNLNIFLIYFITDILTLKKFRAWRIITTDGT